MDESKKYMWVGLAILALIVVVVLIARGGKSNQGDVVLPTGSPDVTIDSDQEPLENGQADDTTMVNNEFKIEDIEVGTGSEAETGKRVTVDYEGTLTDGTKFDSSYDRGQPFSFMLGAGEVIQGWDLGVAGMKEGGKRKLTIPSELAYGSRALPGIPANSTLLFTIELHEVE
jgi:FKBP-type peptidyl-prolyl cis-trans isomerase